jgi:hypothetical protein
MSYSERTSRPGRRSRYSDSLRAGRSWDRIPVGARFSAPLQTGPGAHPASYRMGTISSPGVKRPGRGVNHPSPSSTEVKERVEVYFYFPSELSWPALGRTLSFIKMYFCIWRFFPSSPMRFSVRLHVLWAQWSFMRDWNTVHAFLGLRSHSQASLYFPPFRHWWLSRLVFSS